MFANRLHILEFNEQRENGDYRFYWLTGEFYRLGKYFMVSD